MAYQTNELLFRYATWAAFLERVAGPGGETLSRRASRQLQDEGDHRNWYGTPDFPSALRVAREGWPKGEATARALSQKLFAHVSTAIERQDVSYDTHGHYLDVARFLNNEPECWGVFTTVQADGEGQKLIRLLMNLCVSSGIKSDVLIARGATVAALVELLEYAGHRVEVVVGMGNRGEDKTLLDLRVRVKEFDQALDLGRVIFALAHPSMFRRLIFSAMEVELTPLGRAENWGLAPSYGYGRVAELPATQGEIYVPGADYDNRNWRDPRDAEAWLLDKLAEQGVGLRRDRLGTGA